MASSFTRSLTRTGLGLVLALALAGPFAHAQEAAKPAEQKSAADLSPQCEVPNGDIASPAPLPTMANLLESGKKLKILAIGSSSTYGIGATVRGKAYPAQLEEILEKTLSGVDVKIINRGVSGEIASATAERLKSEVALTHPNLVLWQLGTNDALSHISPEDFENTVQTAVKRMKKRNIDVVLVGLLHFLDESPPFLCFAEAQKVLSQLRPSRQKLVVERQCLTLVGGPFGESIGARKLRPDHVVDFRIRAPTQPRDLAAGQFAERIGAEMR